MESTIIEPMTNVTGVMVRGISESEAAKYETLFKLLDREGQGVIYEEELAELMPRMGVFLSEDELHKLFSSVDIDGSGGIDFHEFLTLMSRHREANQLALLDGGAKTTYKHLQHASKMKQVIRPDDVQSIVCDLFILIAVLFFFGRVLYEDVRGSTVAGDWTPAKVGFGSVYILDVVRGSFTTITSKDRDTLPVDNRKIVRKAYFRSKRFIIDAVSAIPLDCIFLAVNQDIAVQVCQHLRLVKVLAVPFLFRLSPRDNLSPFYTRFYFSFVPLCHLCFWACTVVHGLSCVWMAIASPRPPSDSATEAEPVQYVDAVYFVVYTLTTTGYGDVDVSTDAEKLFAIALFCCASVVTGLVVGKLVQFSQQADLRTDSYRTMLETLAALDHLTIPPGFKEEVLAFQLHRLKHSNSLFNDAMTGLPKVMQDRMALYARMKIVRQVPIFSSAHEICVAKLAQSLVNVFVPPEEYIVIAGEEGEEMFFLFHGMCAVWLASGKWVATIKRGGIFGEAALLQATRRTASIKSLTYCQLFRLDKDAFTGICEEFPVLYDSIASLSRALQKKVSIRPVGPTKEAAPDASEDEMHSAVLASAPQQSEGVAHTTPPPRCYSFPVTTPLTTKSVWNSDKAGTPRNDPGDAPFGENVSANGDDDDEEEHARKPSVDSTNTSLTSGGTSPSSRRRRAHLASRKGEDAGSPLAYQHHRGSRCSMFGQRPRRRSATRQSRQLNEAFFISPKEYTELMQKVAAMASLVSKAAPSTPAQSPTSETRTRSGVNLSSVISKSRNGPPCSG